MNRGIFNVLLAGGIAGAVALSGCNGQGYGSYGSGSSVAPAKTAPNTVAIVNFAFGPSSIAVAKGTTITWQNSDNVSHTATGNSGTWDTGNIAPGASKSVRFDSSGTYPYHCTVHPMMTGTVVVQ